MPPTLPEIVTQFKQAWTTQLEPDAIVAICRHVGYQWRERCLTPDSGRTLQLARCTCTSTGVGRHVRRLLTGVGKRDPAAGRRLGSGDEGAASLLVRSEK